VILLLLASGIAISIMSGLPDALFGGSALPELATLSPRAGHGTGARLLARLVLLHAGAALYHHLISKDRTLTRMSFRKS
jgi:cytochrome b561